MPTWPASLDMSIRVERQIRADDAVLRSNMDAGPPVRRNRFTAITKAFSTRLVLTGAQVATLDTFYHDTLRNGALSFDWKDPRTNATVSMAFKSPPEYSEVIGGPVVADRLWSASLSLEIQP